MRVGAMYPCSCSCATRGHLLREQYLTAHFQAMCPLQSGSPLACLASLGSLDIQASSSSSSSSSAASSSITITIAVISHHRPPTSWTNFRLGTAVHPKGHVLREPNSVGAYSHACGCQVPMHMLMRHEGTSAQGTIFDYPAPKVLSKICFILVDITIAMRSCRSTQSCVGVMYSCAYPCATFMAPSAQGTNFDYPAPKVLSKICCHAFMCVSYTYLCCYRSMRKALGDNSSQADQPARYSS
jgi:hypothetical protein